MPPRPFPSPAFNVGIDICSTARIKAIIQKNPGGPKAPPTPRWAVPQLHRFLRRSFSFHEIILFSRRPNFKDLLLKPKAKRESTVVLDAARYLAGRFAAKEAVIKAVQARRLLLKDVLVAGEKDEQPYAVVLDESPDLTLAQRTILNRFYRFELPTEGEDEQAVDVSAWNPALYHSAPHAQLDECEGQIVKLSISHDGEYATAVCLADEQTGMPSEGGKP